jgi:hypothetical protein
LQKRVDSIGSSGAWNKYITKKWIDKIYKFQDENWLRLLPLHKDSELKDFMMKVAVHQGIGPDKASYACKARMKNKKDPLCERAKQVAREDEDAAKKLYAKNKGLAFVLDCSDKPQSEHPLLAIFPAGGKDESLCGAILRTCKDFETGETIDIADNDNGRLIFFSRTGKLRDTKYVGVTLGTKRRPLPDGISDEIEPLENVIKFHKNEFLEELASQIEVEDLQEEEEEEKPKKGKKNDEEEEED